jgi:hypothetical protein
MDASDPNIGNVTGCLGCGHETELAALTAEVERLTEALNHATGGIGDKLRDMVARRVGASAAGIVCPRERSGMAPCVARDGDCAMTEEGCCVGCGVSVAELLDGEIARSDGAW